jgi:integrase
LQFCRFRGSIRINPFQPIGVNPLPKSLPKRIRFTDLAISRLKEPGIYWDTLLPRFGCRVSHKSKVFIVAIGSGKRRFGRFPELSVAEARRKARQMLAGGVPEPRTPDTFAELAQQFLEHGRTKRGRLLRAKTKGEYRRALLTYAKPLHRQAVREITRARVADVIAATARTRGTTSAMRTRAALSRFFGWCVARGHLELNPVTGTEGYDVSKGKRVLTDGELAALWAATEAPHDFNLIIRLCLWTGCRRSEAGSMAWSELRDGVWLIPGTRVKNHRPLALPLPRQALAELSQWPRVLGKDTVFGRGANGFQAWSQSKSRLDARLGFREDWDLHDVRRSVQTRLRGLGVDRDLVNRILNHAMARIDEVYDVNEYLPGKAEALQLWADRLNEIVTENMTEVVHLQSR